MAHRKSGHQHRLTGNADKADRHFDFVKKYCRLLDLELSRWIDTQSAVETTEVIRFPDNNINATLEGEG